MLGSPARDMQAHAVDWDGLSSPESVSPAHRGPHQGDLVEKSRPRAACRLGTAKALRLASDHSQGSAHTRAHTSVQETTHQDGGLSPL